jgi:replicative DNA helicase
MGKALVKTITRIEELRKMNRLIVGVPSGFEMIDKTTHGWQQPDLIILAARPSVGKTAFALNLARNASNNDLMPVPVGFFSLEMNVEQLTNRLLSAESGIWLERIVTGNLEESHLSTLYKKGVEKLSNCPIYIDDSHGLTLYELRSRARSMKRKEKVGMIIIDYLQLMAGDKKSGNREQEISTISRGLKALAKELEIPIIALSQLSRETEKRSGDKKMPQLSDLRESGAIEQDADIVMFMYRPEYYNQAANEWGESTAGETHIKIAKNRSGSLATVTLRAELSIQKFHDWNGVAAVTEKLSSGNWKPVKDILSEKDAF